MTSRARPGTRRSGTLSTLVEREPPEPWSPGSKLPWHEPDFSARMLREHLSQRHDRASRRLERIDRHVGWIHETVLRGRPGRVLDLGCGPGLYTSRLARRGHTCVGIDFAPASVAHARADAERQGLPCDYRLQDVRAGDFGSGFDAVLLLFGELNTFPPSDVRGILASAHEALAPSGALVLEVHTDRCVRDLGIQLPTWLATRRGLFSDRPCLVLRECTWHAEARVAIERYFVVDAETAGVVVYASTTQAFARSEYAALLRGAGFGRLDEHPSLDGDTLPSDPGLVVLVARPGAARSA